MALQLTGAARRESIANLQIRLPVVVIGGGLTAIDTATESLAYYAVQVEKFLARCETLGGQARVETRKRREIAEEFIGHAQALAQGEAAKDRLALLKSWGGSTIAYRRRMIDSPSYTLNHEEVAKALEEGIVFAEGPDARANRSRCLRRTRRRSSSRASTTLPAALSAGRCRHAAEHGARTRGRRESRAGWQVLPGL